MVRRSRIDRPLQWGIIALPFSDILVTDENNHKLCAIQVKTRRDIGYDKGWHMKPKHEVMIVEDLFYVFVDVGKKPSDPTICYVCIAPGSLDTSLSHAAGLSDIAVCHA